jgi:hypothetical protein
MGSSWTVVIQVISEYMKCPYCVKEAKWTTNDEIYGKRYGHSYMVYLCKDCDAYVGCHQNTKNPLGTMANRELRKLRIDAHNAFDPMWRKTKMTRGQAYRWLASFIGKKEIHIGQSDEKTCLKIIEILKK